MIALLLCIIDILMKLRVFNMESKNASLSTGSSDYMKLLTFEGFIYRTSNTIGRRLPSHFDLFNSGPSISDVLQKAKSSNSKECIPKTVNLNGRSKPHSYLLLPSKELTEMDAGQNKVLARRNIIPCWHSFATYWLFITGRFFDVTKSTKRTSVQHSGLNKRRDICKFS